MEYSDHGFEKMKGDIKLEATNFEEREMPNPIDISDIGVTAIKQEELIIKSETEDACEDNK